MCRHLPACEVSNPKEQSVLNWTQMEHSSNTESKHLQRDEDGEHFLNFPKTHPSVPEKGNA